ncbi:MAG TPA: hypothetical protein VGA66_13035 [Mycobacterium sp.]
MTKPICPMCETSVLDAIDGERIADSIYFRQTLHCSGPDCGFTWWGRKPLPGEPSDPFADIFAHGH